jgi:predicted amidohydrolase
MSDIQLSKDLGFLRVSAAVPELRVANVDSNVGAIIELLRKARNEGVQIVTFPEMALTGYTLGDLIQQQALLLKAKKGLSDILNECAQPICLVRVRRSHRVRDTKGRYASAAIDPRTSRLPSTKPVEAVGVSLGICAAERARPHN